AQEGLVGGRRAELAARADGAGDQQEDEEGGDAGAGPQQRLLAPLGRLLLLLVLGLLPQLEVDAPHGRPPAGAGPQLTVMDTSPPARVARACHTDRVIVSRKKRTDPSAMAALTPPGCSLRADAQTLPSLRLRVQISREFGGPLQVGGQAGMTSVPGEL